MYEIVYGKLQGTPWTNIDYFINGCLFCVLNKLAIISAVFEKPSFLNIVMSSRQICEGMFRSSRM
jgi:hypothetical protein